MTMTKIILGLLIVAISLISCESQKEEDVKVSLTYSHEQSRQKSIRSPIVISKHTIDVADYDYKNIYDSTELDQSMTGTVMVPVDVNLEVQYKNYTLEEPKIHYESGFSDPFVVTHSQLQPPLLLFLFLSIQIILVKWLKKKLLTMRQLIMKPFS